MKSFTGLRGSGVVLSGLAAGMAGLALVAAATVGLRPAAALPQYAAQTKLPCGQCHVNPAGGGGLKPFGQRFQNNGHKLK